MYNNISIFISLSQHPESAPIQPNTIKMNMKPLPQSQGLNTVHCNLPLMVVYIEINYVSWINYNVCFPI